MVTGGGGGRPLEATGGHRGQFPRTDFGLASQIYFCYNTAGTPKATLVWGIILLQTPGAKSRNDGPATTTVTLGESSDQRSPFDNLHFAGKLTTAAEAAPPLPHGPSCPR